MSEAILFQQQATIYALLSRIFFRELDLQSLAILQEPDVLTVFEKLHNGFRDYIENTSWDDKQLENLASDYCHLFILPQKSSLSLQASHWVSNEESGGIAQIEALINRSGVDLSGMSQQPLDHVPNDHLGVLLAFMGAVYASDSPELRKLGPQLGSQLLSPWIKRFDHKLSTVTSNPIYLASSRLLVELLEHTGTDSKSNRS